VSLLENPLANSFVICAHGGLNEGFDLILPAHCIFGYLDNATSTNCGQGCMVEVLTFEQDANREVEFDALSVTQAQ
jgi:hypothetical protein